MRKEDWILMEDRQPDHKDVPFLTMHYKLSRFPESGVTFEYVNLWDDSDWFEELTDEERSMWKYWMPIVDPEE